MGDLRCARCGDEASYADAAIADRLRTCGDFDDLRVVGHSAIGRVYNGREHDWVVDDG